MTILEAVFCDPVGLEKFCRCRVKAAFFNAQLGLLSRVHSIDESIAHRRATDDFDA